MMVMTQQFFDFLLLYNISTDSFLMGIKGNLLKHQILLFSYETLV